MNATQLARKLKTSTRVVGQLIKTGRIKAVKVKRAWEIDPASVKCFCRRNDNAIDKLRQKYIALYWGGALRCRSYKNGSEMILPSAVSFTQSVGLQSRPYTMSTCERQDSLKPSAADEMCKQCLLGWLSRPAEEEK